jgi:hypothetical protein
LFRGGRLSGVLFPEPVGRFGFEMRVLSSLRGAVKSLAGDFRPVIKALLPGSMIARRGEDISGLIPS